MLGTQPGSVIYVCNSLIGSYGKDGTDFARIFKAGWDKTFSSGRFAELSFKEFSERLDEAIKGEESAGWGSTDTIVRRIIHERLGHLKNELKEFKLSQSWSASFRVLTSRPLQHGLLQFLNEKKEWFMDRIVEASLRKIPHGDISIQDVADLTEGFNTRKSVEPHIQLLFDTAGSGKTRSILGTLCRHWGFYFVAPNLRPTIKQSAESKHSLNDTLLDATRGSASRDTYTAYEDLSALKNSCLKWGSLDFDVERLSHQTTHGSMICARFDLLKAFHRISRRLEGYEPESVSFANKMK
ncbi:hypothetical protein ACJ41O_010721 [Fusarium nematophilum]